MRDIKFRIFDGIEMDYNVIGFDYNCGGIKKDVVATFNKKYGTELFRISDSFPLMQYTGVKDKNGKEIYEGDIVKVYRRFSDDMLLLGEVKYGEFKYSACDEYTCKRYGYYANKKWEDYCCNTGYPIQPDEKIEVIGNVYENKYLLEK